MRANDYCDAQASIGGRRGMSSDPGPTFEGFLSMSSR